MSSGLNRYWAALSERLKEEPGWSRPLNHYDLHYRYGYLTSREHTKKGQWDAEEQRKLEEAVLEQIGPGYRPIIEVLKNASGKARKNQDGDGLKYLMLGSKELKSVRWVKVAEKVGTRTYQVCRAHFYLHNTNCATGRWSPEENKKLLEGYEKFGDDFDAISGYVGTRGPKQVVLKMIKRNIPLRSQ